MNKVDLDKGNKLCKDEPELNPLDVGGLCQPGQHAAHEVGHCQHHGQVGRYGRVEEIGEAEKGGGVAE